MHKEILLYCEKCQWIGTHKEVDWYSVETCTGPENIEICPKCFSYDIVAKKDVLSTQSNSSTKQYSNYG